MYTAQPPKKRVNHHLGTILKAGKVIDLFTVEHPEWGVSEVAEELVLARASACQLLATLAEIGLLRHTPNNRYRLGWRLLLLARTLLESTEFRNEALKAMDHLTGRYREAVYLATLDGDDVVCVTNQDGNLVDAGVADRLLMHSSAVGKILIADKSWAEVRQIIRRRGLPALTSKTISQEARLQAEWHTVRKQGYAFALEETERDLCCVAAPIFDDVGHIIAALCVSGSADFFRSYQQDLVQSVCRVSREVSDSLGYLQKGEIQHDVYHSSDESRRHRN